MRDRHIIFRFLKLFDISPSCLLNIDSATDGLVGNGRLFGADFLAQVAGANRSIR
jgi:hypothetical protein